MIRERKMEGGQSSKDVEDLKEKGKILRDELRAAVLNFNRVNDHIIVLVFSLPNILDPQTPAENSLLKTVAVPAGVKHWTTPRSHGRTHALYLLAPVYSPSVMRLKWHRQYQQSHEVRVPRAHSHQIRRPQGHRLETRARLHGL